MANIFSNLTQTDISGDAVDVITATIINGGSDIEFFIDFYTVYRYINNTYVSTTDADESGIITLPASSADLAVGATNTIKFDIASSGYSGVAEWTVVVEDELADPGIPTFTSQDLNVTFYSNNDDDSEKIKLDGFDPTLIDYVTYEYKLQDATIVDGSFSEITESPFCATFADVGIETINTMIVYYSDGTSAEIISNLDYANDLDIQSNTWPGECIEGSGDTNPPSSEDPDPLLRIAVALEGISAILSGGITVKPEPTEEWAFNRAATVNALREAQQLENVFSEMANPTKYPDVGYKSEGELNSQPTEFFRPEADNFDPSYEERGCSFDPIPPEELEPLEEPTDEGSGESEESCHPAY